MPDRDLLARLPQVALDKLPRPIDRPLERPRHQEPRADLAHEVIKDRLAAQIPISLASSRNRCDWIRGSATNCSQIQSRNGSSFDATGAR